MSKVEHDSWRESACLCGLGQVTRHVSSTDYVFGSADVSFSLDCPVCAGEWDLNHKTFTLRSSAVAAADFYAQWTQACDALSRLSAKVVDDHFARLGRLTRKAELAELIRLGLTAGTYRTYLSARQGRSPGQVAGAHGDSSGLISIAGPAAPDVRRLVRARDELRRQWEAAGKQIVRRALPPD
jgi:hypothetical protein